MKIIQNSVVSLRYTVRDSAGEVVDRGDSLVYLHGGYQGIFPAIEEALAGKDVGERISLRLSPNEGFGERDPELVRVEPRDRLPGKVKVGMQFQGEMQHGDHVHSMVFRVVKVTDKEVTLDGNHPLAGQDIEFAATVTDVRPATTEEVAHGHAHGPGGHHH